PALADHRRGGDGAILGQRHRERPPAAPPVALSAGHTGGAPASGYDRRHQSPDGEELMRAAVIGLGWWGRMIIRSLADSDRITVSHGVDPAPPPSAAELAAQHGVTLSDDFDAVLADKTVDA